ncbi:hypothetical protein CDAR_448671 [Caerostris darwini]|uniref:Uncharacterized protein n=1 Tax=Caerostris darwini TaxID=1538125 RepID=A0AAV4QL49_9ARAC|nr:hypothetical protein CDAR_448671 [Caerostris darwini]
MRLFAVARREHLIEVRPSGEEAKTRRMKSVTGSDGRLKSLWRQFSGWVLIKIGNVRLDGRKKRGEVFKKPEVFRLSEKRPFFGMRLKTF